MVTKDWLFVEDSAIRMRSTNARLTSGLPTNSSQAKIVVVISPEGRPCDLQGYWHAPSVWNGGTMVAVLVASLHREL